MEAIEIMENPHKNDRRYHFSWDYVSDPIEYGCLKLFQIGRSHCKEETIIETHAHRNWFELTIATDGAGYVSTNGQEIRIERGDIYLSFPGEFHGIRSDAVTPLKYDFYAFYPNEPEMVDAMERIMRVCHDADQRTVRDERISFLVSNALAEIHLPGEFSQRLLQVIFMQILFYIIQDFRDLPRRSSQKGVGEHEEICYQIMNYIDTHIYSMKSLHELSDIFCYNYSYLSDLFRRVTKDSLKGYYQARRLEVAKKLIQEDELKLSQIAELLHYSSIYTFSRSFKEKYGVAPSRIRKA